MNLNEAADIMLEEHEVVVGDDCVELSANLILHRCHRISRDMLSN
jgi:hypothetical protein